MFIFRWLFGWMIPKGAPVTFVQDGYEVDYERNPPGTGGMSCFKLLWLAGLGLIVLAGVFVGIAWVVVNVINGATSPAPTPTLIVQQFGAIDATEQTSTPTQTLDGWSATGTALMFATASATPTASPTQDFCAWLTPTATHTPTLIYTPDNWAATGTAIYFETSTPTLQPSPTATTPRSWCDYQTATLTPLPLRDRETAAAIIPGTPTPIPTLAPTDTPRPPTSIPAMPALPTAAQFQPSPLPPIIIPPSPLPPPTALPPTATRRPKRTKVPTATHTATATDMPLPTVQPMLVIKSADCLQGFPVFGVDNFGGDALNVYWSITLATGEVVNNGIWEWFPTGTSAEAAAPAWASIEGIYLFAIYQSWSMTQPVVATQLNCDYGPTPTPTDTATTYATLTLTIAPEQTAEITPTPTATAEVTP